MTDCKHCFGTGSLDVGVDSHGIPLTKSCVCQVARDIVRNLNRGWAGLSSAAKVTVSHLGPYVDKNLYVTATDSTLRTHLRHVGLRASPYWGFKVVTDSDLMTAWLSPAAFVGKEILDPDSASVSSEKATLVDLVEPPELLIIRLGVKSARNSAMGEVLLEALYHRSHINRPTWVVDQPSRRFDPSHLAFSEDGLHHIHHWERLILDEPVPGLDIEMVSGTGEAPASTPETPGGLTLSAGYASPDTTTQHTTRIERPVPEPKKRKFQRKEE